MSPVLAYTIKKVKKGPILSLIHPPRKIRSWAQSRLGRPIALYHSGDFEWDASARPIVLMGGVHGDEREGVILAQAVLDWLCHNGAAVPWIVIPCLNPDGFAREERTNGAGVDLNRNYPAQSWSPEAKEPRYSPGPHPASEPEIQAVVKLMQDLRPRLMIHCHSWKPCIVATGEPALPDAQRLARVSGYDLQESIGYDTPGSLSQYGWFDQRIPIICIEEQEGTPVDLVWPHFARGIQEIFEDASPREIPAKGAP